ncbi:MAG: hypothetical protein Q9217_000848 [Psora testacea]
MAEVGIAASVAGLVSLGLKVCQGLTAYYKAYSKAEDDVKCLCFEVKALTQSLSSFKESIQNCHVNTDPESFVVDLIEACRARILDLDVELGKISNIRHDGRRSMRRVMSRTVRAMYPFKAATISSLRDNISRANEALQQVASTVLIRQNTAIQDTIDQFYTKEESKEIIRWLDPPSPASSHGDASAKHRQATGTWLLGNAGFSEWKNSPNSVLWIQGCAGTGKTVLASAIINTLLEDCEKQARAGIAFFYFDFNNQSIMQDHNRLLRSLIEQLSSECGDIPKPLAALYRRCRNGTVQPMTTDLLRTLQSIIQNFSQFYLIIDAFDECKEKQEFLRFLNAVAMWKFPQTHIVVTSRTDIDTEIRSRKWNCSKIAVEEHLVDADIDKHVQATLEDDEILNRWDPEQRRLIAKSLIEGAKGNFRWVACQIETLKDCHTLAELEDALCCLPATLEETYERALSLIDEKRKEPIRNVLRWLCFSARPILLEEIAEVMAIDFTAKPRPVYDPRKRLIDSERFFQTYSSLLHVLKTKSKKAEFRELGLAHLSVKDFLVSLKIRGSTVSYFAIDPLSAHTSIAQTCLIYLRQFDKPLELASRHPESYSLARYAAKHWPFHVQEVVGAAGRLLRTPTDQLAKVSSGDQSMPLITLIIEFLLQILKVLSSSSTSAQVQDLPTDLNYLCSELLSAQDAQLQSQILFFDPDMPWIEQPDVARTLNILPSALYYAAHAGLETSVKMLLAKGADVNATGGRYGNALQAAACKGHLDVVELLLAGGADVNQAGGDYGNALQGACSYGHRRCAMLLIVNGADVNAKGGEHGTALHAAAFIGHERIAALLIENGAEIDCLDDAHSTPLLWAAREGHHETVQLLLKHGADCMIQDEGGWTALDECAPPGFDSIVQMLIDHRPPIIHSKDKQDYTALHHTAPQHHDSTVTILVNAGMDIDARNCYGRTPIFQAVGSGHEETVRVFLEKGANVNTIDNEGWSVLHIAVFSGHISISALLLDYGAKINYDVDGITPLHIAVLRKSIDFVELLLEYDADITVCNDVGGTALEFLQFHEQGQAHNVLQNLRIQNPNVTITGLRIAVCSGREARIRRLLELGADINARDEGGMTALLWASEQDSPSIMKMLLDHGADPNVRSDWGSTPMSGVRCNPELEEMLLSHGYNMDTLQRRDTSASEKQDGDNELEEIKELLLERMNESSMAEGFTPSTDLENSFDELPIRAA